MIYYIIPVAVAALMVGIFILTDKMVKNENAKQWIFKAMTLLFLVAFVVRYLSAKQVMMNTVGLNIRSPFGIHGQNETAFSMFARASLLFPIFQRITAMLLQLAAVS